MKYFLIILSLFLVGCQDSSYNRPKAPPRPECTCPPTPDFYMVNLEFTDQEGKKRSFPYKVDWYGSRYEDSHGAWDDLPDTIYVTKGVSADGPSWYYSLKEPDRQPNGLIVIEQADGPTVKVDLKDIEITLRPCQPKPLDDESARRIEAALSYIEHHEKICPVHKKNGWNDKYTNGGYDY